MNNLFDTFNPVSEKEWKQKIQVDLKGADYNDTLIWQSLEGIHVKPFYHQDGLKSNSHNIPGQPENWAITQCVFIDNATIASKLVNNAIQGGAEAIYLVAEKKFDFEKLFKNFPFDKIVLYINLFFLHEEFSSNLKQYVHSRGAKVHFAFDIFGQLARTGNWFLSQKEDHAILSKLLSNKPNEHTLTVDATTYQNAGANCVQQLAYALSHANEYLNQFGSKLHSQKMSFQIAVGSNYFFEIAKIRALRLLYASIASAYELPTTCHIIATPSKRNKTIYDYNVNMLRTTTECMSAVLGGADAVMNLPYDALYHKSNSFGERISRNQLLILKAESYFDMVSNPADGSYYIEVLTQQLAEKALALFKNIESGGGFLRQLTEGTIQKKISESATKEQELFNTGAITAIGTNKHPNEQDRMKHDLELYPFLKKEARKTLIRPIITKRLSETLEKNRLENE